MAKRRYRAAHGYLFLGTAETTINLDQNFQPVTEGRAVVYRPK